MVMVFGCGTFRSALSFATEIPLTSHGVLSEHLLDILVDEPSRARRTDHVMRHFQNSNAEAGVAVSLASFIRCLYIAVGGHLKS